MNLRPVDLVVLLLVFILVVFFVGLTYSLIVSAGNLTDKGREIIDGLLLSLVAIISLYVGSKIKKDG